MSISGISRRISQFYELLGAFYKHFNVRSHFQPQLVQDLTFDFDFNFIGVWVFPVVRVMKTRNGKMNCSSMLSVCHESSFASFTSIKSIKDLLTTFNGILLKNSELRENKQIVLNSQYFEIIDN